MLPRPLCRLLQGSSRSAVLPPPAEPLAGAIHAMGTAGCHLAWPAMWRGLRGTGQSLSLQQPRAVARPHWRSKAIRWPPEPQAPASGRLLTLNDGDLFYHLLSRLSRAAEGRGAGAVP